MVEPSAPVWRELGGLRELSLTSKLACLPASLLDGLINLRVLRLKRQFHRDDEGPCHFRVTDTALQRLTQLTILELRGIAHCRTYNGPSRHLLDAVSFTGSSLAALRSLRTLTISGAVLPPAFLTFVPPGLQSLDVASCEMPPDPFASLPASVKTLTISNCHDLSDAAFAPLVHVRSLIASGIAISYMAFAGLEALEELILSNMGYGGPRLLCDELFGILGSFGRIRRLSLPSSYLANYNAKFTDAGLGQLARCPLEQLDLKMKMPQAHISDGGLAQLAACPLKVISLSGIYRDVSQAALANFPGLRVLGLNGNHSRRHFFPGPYYNRVASSLTLKDFSPALVVRDMCCGVAFTCRVTTRTLPLAVHRLLWFQEPNPADSLPRVARASHPSFGWVP